MDPGYFDIPRQEHPYVKANIFSKLSFWYTRPLFIKGRNGDLSMSDVYRCLPDHRGVLQGDSLGVIWRREVDSKGKNKKPSLLRAIIKLHGYKYFMVNLLYSILDSSIRLSTPWCLEGLIKYFSVTNSGVDTYQAYLYAAGVVGFMLVAAGMNHSMILFAVDISTKVQIACCSLVYRKLLRLDVSAGGVACEGLAGHVVNLQTTDIQRFHLASIQAVDMIRAPLESIVTVYLMYRYIGVSTFIGVAFLMLFIPLQAYLGKLTSRLRGQIAARTDNRIRLMNEVIQSIETIKMYVWETAFAGIVGKARKKEMAFIKKMSWLRAVMISCVKLNTKVAIFLSIISYISFGNELTAAKVFVIFSYYDILKMSLVDSLPLGIASTMEALVGVRRVQEFLLLPEVDNQDGVDLLTINPEKESKRVFEKIGNGTQTYIQSETVEHMEPNVLVSFKQFTAHWRTAHEKADKTVALSNINLNILPGTLTVVIGAVGSGKTTLLHAILRELPSAAGRVDIACVTSYASQDPWIFEGTVRQNILFGQELDLRRYKAVVKCCQLRSDLELLPHGDRTVVGERGASLSGGQRARLSLARCLYRAADLYLLDDPLAAVDAKVAQALYEECVRGFLRDRAVVLVTHHVHYARQADNICVMRNGRIAAQGTYQELKNSVPELHVESNAIAEVKEKVEYERHESMELTRRIRSQRSMSSVSQLSFSMDLDKTEPKYEGETQTKGSVERDTYVQYIRSGGGACTVVILLALFVVAQLFYSASDVWLKDWVNLEESYSMKLVNSSLQLDNQTESVEYTDITANKFGLSRSACVYVYAALIGVCVFFTWNKLLLFYNTCIRASVALHDNMFRGVTNAPMWFFHHNPSGRILNRFSKDMGQVDSLLPIALVDCFGIAAQGTYQELKNSVPELHVESNAIAEVKEKVEYERHESMELTRRIRSQRSMSSVSQLSFSMDLDKTEPKYEGETQTKGSVERDTYVQYIRSGGGACTVVILLALFVVAQLFYSASDVWLKDWVNLEESYSMKLVNSSLQLDNQTESVEYTDITANKFGLSRSACVYVYAALIGVCVFFTWNKLLLFYNTCIRASVALHDNMFRGVTNAPMWFFHHNPSGRILNRFSKDMGQVDSLLPIALVDCFGFFLEIIAILVVVCLVNWWLALPTAAVSVLLYLIRSYYIGTSRELKRMEAVAKSQVLNHANCTVSGLTTVRSCGGLQRTLCRELDKLQDLHSAAWFLYVSANRAFGFWMDMICCVYLAVVTFSFFLFVGEESLGGAVGLAITQAISLVNICRLGMRQTAEVENQMTSVERILEYANLPSEEPLEPDMKALKENHPNLNFETWPEKGEIVFEDVSLEYEKPPRKDASSEKGAGEEPAYAIRGVHFRVRAGEKVCVVGRTGAGKSSLIAALFGLARTHGGVAVDGVRARSAGLRAWRRRLCALPQRPALFAGTLRDNLDPTGARTDAELHAALREVGLGALAGAAEGLSWRVGDGGGNLSSGQRQLLCLARAVLARPRVLVLDEATANVDGETDKEIQASIRTKFAASTVLTIAHRLHTVMDYDRVIVMDKGRVAETGHPYELLTRSDSTPIKRSFKRQISQTIPEHSASSNDLEETSRLAEGAGIFKSLVEQAGPETAATLFEMAKESYRRMEVMKADQADKTKV